MSGAGHGDGGAASDRPQRRRKSRTDNKQYKRTEASEQESADRPATGKGDRGKKGDNVRSHAA